MGQGGAMVVGSGGRAWWRWLAVLLLLLLVAHAARVPLLETSGERRPERALALWPSHPVPLFATSLTGIGAAAREGRRPDPALLDLMERGARGAPLAPEPLWVEATARIEAGNVASAERLLRLAIRLDARAPAGRFLLADLAIRQGRLDEALVQLGALQRRVPGIAAGLAPALATYVRQPGALAAIAPMLERDPPLRETLLQGMAADPSNTPLLLSLARPGDERSGWFAAVVQRLLDGGDVGSVARLLGRVLPGEPLGDKLTPLGERRSANPFAWRFPETGSGLAEPVAGGSIRILYYGREDAVLAEHLLRLAPGRYRLADRFGGAMPPSTFEWQLACRKGGRQLGFQPAAAAGPGLFRVPADCPVQRLVLLGKAGEIAATTRAELQSVTLSPAAAG